MGDVRQESLGTHQGELAWRQLDHPVDQHHHDHQPDRHATLQTEPPYGHAYDMLADS